MEEQEIIKLTKFSINPDGVCPLGAPLSLEMGYTLLSPVANAQWELVYVADYTQKRVEIPLHTNTVGSLAAGPHTYSHTLETIPTTGVKEKYLMQVGLLKLTLKADGGKENVASVNMVVQVSKDGSGALIRNIISPME